MTKILTLVIFCSAGFGFQAQAANAATRVQQVSDTLSDDAPETPESCAVKELAYAGFGKCGVLKVEPRTLPNGQEVNVEYIDPTVPAVAR